ncbi:hypothetical protein [Aromatoleum aromaticum]|uniref:hypothetical protein n=1 Tax=Aromatoleum aromaticum TaxID=551760 RepID=UPI0002E42C5E|nr:hypothetical protein [Aromatoleum aromaticum]
MIPRLLPLLLAVAAAAAGAAEADLEHAERLRDEARALRAEADDALRRAEPACYERFLVNHCIAQAKEQRLDKIRKARAIEAEANRLELAEKQRQAALRGAVPPPAPPSDAQAPQLVAPPPAAPSADPQITPDPAAEATRRERDAQAARDAATARDRQREQDAEKARERSKAEAEAAKRAEDAARDRARYDERIRKREQEKEKEKAGN